MRHVIGLDELHFYGALALVAIGCWDLWRPGSFLIPAFVLLWVSTPQRHAFVVRPHEPPKKGN